MICRSCDPPREIPGRTVEDFYAHFNPVHFWVPVTGHTPATWERAAEQLIREHAKSGVAFTIAEALASLGPHPDPAQAQFAPGRITGALASAGVIQHAEQQATQSLKETSHRSLVRVWIGATERTAAA